MQSHARRQVLMLSALRSLVVSVAQACLFRGLALNAFLARTNDIGLSILGAACVSAIAQLGLPGAAFFPDLLASMVYGIVYGSASYNLLVRSITHPPPPLSTAMLPSSRVSPLPPPYPAYPYSPILTHAHPCSPIPCLPILTHTHPYSPTLTHTHPYSPTLTHTTHTASCSGRCPC